MKTGRRYLLFIAAILLVIYVIAPSLKGFNTPVLRASETEEYAVYNAVIKDMSLGRFFVIRDHTSPGLFKYMGEPCFRCRFPLVEEVTAEDFVSKNEQSYPLKNRFDVGALVVLISDEEVRGIFQGTFGWLEFYVRYPFSHGLTELSRVGFNAGMDQALVYVGNTEGGLSGEGYYVLLIKEEGRWIVQDKTLVWVS
ncbi:MAG: hypothetical protein HXS40_11915 [Theionarchaea archaeon]|nr:hypothetical protein [Theionarchaea archaeon]